ncbi:hypothetical protein AWB98_01365 [Mycolicibacterium conceptionense]|uniref:Bacteriophage protein n=2 Tax=Mycolicibacterium conceptionense TaxID=451644 RepID=A0ABX3UZS8_9MYCO|nr:hypothetical protein AWB98_01365 [Mycolicibacterium conceptionense]
MVGEQRQSGSLAAQLQRAMFAATGQHGQQGDLSAILQRASFSGTNITQGQLQAALQAPRAALLGEQRLTGAMASTLRPVVASAMGQKIYTGTMAGELEAAIATLTGSQTIPGNIAAQLRPLLLSANGIQTQSGSIAAALRSVLFSGIGTQGIPGTLAGALQRASGSFNGTMKSLVQFDAFSVGGSGGTSTRSWAHDLDGNCIVVVFTNTTSSNPTCTYGGVNIPRVFGPSSDGGVFPYTSYISIYALVSNSLPQGSNTVSVNQAGTASAATAMSFKNAGSIGTVITDTSSGNISRSTANGEGSAAVAGYVGGASNFGTLSPTQAANYGFITFITWATVAGWGIDTGTGINFSGSHSGAKTGAVVPILPA